MRLLPRFTLRTTLWGMVVMAVVSVVASQAVRGSGWALAIVIGLASLVLTLAVHTLIWLLVQSFIAITAGAAKRSPAKATSGEAQA